MEAQEVMTAWQRQEDTLYARRPESDSQERDMRQL